MAVTTGCGAGLATQSGGWVQVDTEDVRIRTDLAESQATELAEDLQRHRDALVQTSFKCGSAQLTQPLHITFFAKESDFNAVAPRDARTIVEPGKTGLAELPPELLMKPTRNRRLLRQAVLHEMVHALSAECYPGLPPWLSEGLSLFYETVEIEGDALIAGRQKYAIVRQGEIPNEIARTREEITVIPHTAVPTLSELLAFDFSEFYQYIDYYDAFQEREKVLLLGRYAGAWALTHALMTADIATYSRLQQFMLELRFGEESVAEAWHSTMSGIDLNLLYSDWTSINVRYPTIALGFEDSGPSTTTARPMAEAEVELHLAARWDWNDEEGRARAIEHLDRSIELNPNATRGVPRARRALGGDRRRGGGGGLAFKGGGPRPGGPERPPKRARVPNQRAPGAPEDQPRHRGGGHSARGSRHDGRAV